MHQMNKLNEDSRTFCMTVESACEVLWDPRLGTRRGTIEVLNEYGKYLNIIKSPAIIWYNQAKTSEGAKIWFEV